jgi:hypothetical protein
MECIVEDNHWYDINQYKWNCYKHENGEINGYPFSNVNGKVITLHKYVYETYVGQIPSNMSVDHVNSDAKLDTRIQNLRLADHSLQNHNRNTPKNRIDKYKGINFVTSGYEVKIDGIYYGIYKTAEKAAEKANEVYTTRYGSQANLNIIDYSKQTTKYNRIPEENITKEYILNLTKVIDVKNVITIKKLKTKGEGAIKISDIKLVTLDKYKQIIVDELYPSTNFVLV